MCTTKFLRLVEHNKLMEIKGQLVVKYLDGLNPAIRDRIVVQMLLNVFEA